MKKIHIIQLVILLLPISMWAQEWQLVWADEFEGESLDLEKWSYQTGTGTEYGFTDWGNNELQYYREDNITVAEGNLTITAKEENYNGKAFTSGRIRTVGKGDWTYCRIEFRAKMPLGKGLRAAVWMLPTDEVYGGWAASGELDIMEYLGNEHNTVHGTLHYGNTWPNNKSSGTSFTLTDGSFNSEFHNFALEWVEGEIRWYVDGHLYQTQGEGDWWSSGGDFPAPFDKQFHLLINLAVGGNWPGSPDGSTIFPQELILDYVKIYQWSELCDNSNIKIDAQITQPLCFGGSDGSIDVSVTGNYPGFTYSWSTGHSTERIDNLSKGVYEILITDSEGCTKREQLSVIEPDSISITEKTYEPLCNGDSNGSVKINISGGIAPYSIQWYDNSSLDSIYGLVSDCYNVEINDVNGCIKQEDICIDEPSPLSLNLSKQDNPCFGDSSGAIYSSASGGTPDYDYYWSEEGLEQENGRLKAGIYSITAVDQNKCQVTDSVALVDPDKILIDNIIGADWVDEFLTYTYSLTEREGFIYHWIVEGGNVLSGQGTHVVEIQWGSNVSGIIKAFIESENGCLSDTSLLAINISTNGVNLEKSEALDIYPNPMNNVLNIETGNIGLHSIKVFALNGQQILTGEMEGKFHQIDLSTLQKGVYFISIRSKDFVTTRKIIKY